MLDEGKKEQAEQYKKQILQQKEESEREVNKLKIKMAQMERGIAIDKVRM